MIEFRVSELIDSHHDFFCLLGRLLHARHCLVRYACWSLDKVLEYWHC